ncbi:MAG: FAD-dependent oxidoreductase [Candidatus Geothermarchaeales archaeon]
MIGVFICECGENIAKTVDVRAVRDAAKGVGEVRVAQVNKFLCSKPGLKMIEGAVKRLGLDGVVVAACSPHMHEKTFQRCVSEAGLNPYLLTHVNIREQCSWVHSDREKATDKATDLILAGIQRTLNLKPLTSTEVGVERSVMVIGGGIAGITTALQLAEAGQEVVMVERRPSIGGRMAQLSKTFPTLDCAPCILSPRMAEVEGNPNITLHTNAEVVGVEGGPGNFEVRVRVKPRGVDTEKCTKCGLCATVCPVTVPSEFEEGLYERRAAYMPYPQAVPSAYVIDFEDCTRCGRCVEKCAIQAINLNEGEKELTHRVGAIVVATGFDLIDKDSIKPYWPSHPDVISALQMERLVENELAAGKVLKTSDGRRVRSIAYVLCVGSRDPHSGVPYCSSVCCPYTVKQAILLKETLPYLNVWIYAIDVRMSGKGFEEFYRRARDMGITFIRGKPAEVKVLSGKNRLEVVAEDRDLDQLIISHPDVVVLSSAMVPSGGVDQLAEMLKTPLGEDGFVAERHPKLDPVSTLREGVFAAGSALGPRDVKDSVVDGRAAASQASNFIGDGRRVVDPVKPLIVGNCDQCGDCVGVCPYGALSIDGELTVDVISCTGCGICVAACKREALELSHYTKEQLVAEIDGLLSREAEDVRIVAFCGDKIAYTALDSAGTARMQYPPNIEVVRVPSTALLGGDMILRCLREGADAVILLDEEGSREAEAALKVVDVVRSSLGELGVEEERVHFQPVLLPMYKALPDIIDRYVRKIKGLGKLDKVGRGKISKLMAA